MLIRDLETRTGLDRATIRFYEKEGLITPVRQENGYREYSEQDCANLLKIKLLRQLGMPLQKIKDLQEGREDFVAAMDARLQELEQQLQRTAQTKDVCIRIRNTESSYQDLNAAYYLNLLDEPYPQKPALPAFHEQVRRERHPWRRYIARMIDIALVTYLVEYVIIVALRIRPYNFGIVIEYAAPFLCIPVYALCLHMWGTTPGKFVFGLRVESVNGERLSMHDALWREFNVLRYGMGYGIPIYGLWRLYKSFTEYTQEGTLEYDEDCEYFYDQFDRKKKIQLTSLIAVGALLICVNLFDNAKPTNRGNLTVAEFSENYNDYIQGETFDSPRKMTKNGQWDPYQSGVNIWLDEPENKETTFQFHCEKGSIRSITYQNSWTNPMMVNPLGGEPFMVAYTLAASQNNFSYWNLQGFNKAYENQLQEATAEGLQNGFTEGGFTYENITIGWQIYAENVNLFDGKYYTKTDNYVNDIDASIELSFTITILDK